MIPLLQELAAAEAAHPFPRTDEQERALRLLEWPRVTAQIAGGCLCRRAAAAVAARRPSVGLGPIALRWRLADELRGTGDRGEWPPLVEVSDAMDLLERPRPLRLEGPELLHLAGVGEGLDALGEDLRRRPEARPTWSAAAARLEPCGGFAAAVRRALDRDGRLRDDATPLLLRLRRAARDREREVRAAAERAMAQARAQGLTTGSEVTLRGERFCLPLRAGGRRRVDGIVHDRSATGGTVFVEPADCVELHNGLIEVRLEAAAEEARILFELNRLADTASGPMLEAGRLLLLVDETRAALLWSRRCRGRRPQLGEGRTLRLCAARHPLLEWRGDGQAAPVVPLDLELPPERRVLLISGPNAGGKSVALKTVGVCALLAQSGWDVPAREDTRLPLVRRIFVDLGDEQSIEMSLSSFSAHLVHLVRFLAGSDEGTLILCDEIGSGTDPEEGAALAFTVLEGLAERGATVLASTHYGLLKAAIHDHPAMLNAAMDFDDATLRPLFTLRAGAPGASHAFAIAARGGFPAALLARARARVGEERFRIERLLQELGSRARELETLEGRAREAAAAAAAHEGELAGRLADLDRERTAQLEAARQEGERLLQEARRRIEAAVREIRGSGAGRESVRSARDVVRELQRQVETPASSAPAPAPAPALRPGDRVRIPAFGLVGEVIETRGDRVTAEARGMRLTLTAREVEPLPEADQPEAAGEEAAAGWNWTTAAGSASREIDLRGARGEEAWEQLDLLLDRAIPAGVPELLVVHGIGTGRLRAFLHERLAADRRVASWSEAPADRGGAGATLVRLAET